MGCTSLPVLGAAGSALGSITQAGASLSAANTQASAAEAAANAQLAEFNTTQANLSPFMSVGTGAIPALTALTGTSPAGTSGGPGLTSTGNPLTSYLTQPFTPTPAQLAATPGYQFTLNQGLQNTQAGYAASGLGQSGAALKGAANYATGLANSTWQSQWQQQMAQQQQIYNMLGGQVTTGQNAAANLGGLGLQATTAANQFNTAGAAASAAGTVGAANALSAGSNNTALLLALQNSGMYTGPSGGGAPGGSSGTQAMS